MAAIAVGSGPTTPPPLSSDNTEGVCVCNDITSLERENCRHILTAATLDECSTTLRVRLPINTNSPITTLTNIIRSYTSRLHCVL